MLITKDEINKQYRVDETTKSVIVAVTIKNRKVNTFLFNKFYSLMDDYAINPLYKSVGIRDRDPKEGNIEAIFWLCFNSLDQASRELKNIMQVFTQEEENLFSFYPMDGDKYLKVLNEQYSKRHNQELDERKNNTSSESWIQDFKLSELETSADCVSPTISAVIVLSVNERFNEINSNYRNNFISENKRMQLVKQLRAELAQAQTEKKDVKAVMASISDQITKMKEAYQLISKENYLEEYHEVRLLDFKELPNYKLMSINVPTSSPVILQQLGIKQELLTSRETNFHDFNNSRFVELVVDMETGQIQNFEQLKALVLKKLRSQFN